MAEEITSHLFIVSWKESGEGGGATEISEYILFWESDNCSDTIITENTKINIQLLTSNTEYTVFVAVIGNQMIAGEFDNTKVITRKLATMKNVKNFTLAVANFH